jgi:hypothetical protein
MNAICIITFIPNIIWCDFLNLFTTYKIFIIVDNNKFNLIKFKNNYKNIIFIQVEDTKCEQNGYINTNYAIKKIISGWDKALYYFSIEDKNYDLIWFIEDDVFFYNENTIIQIDNQYINDDLLSNGYGISTNDNNQWYWWDKVNIQYPPPYYNGMMCAVRFSKNMLKCINEYAIKYNTLFFLEALFPTIAIKNNLKYNNPCEFNNITWKYSFEKKYINTNNFYHPVKKMNDHIYFRQL